MRPGTEKWHTGKHPVIKGIDGLLLTLEDYAGQYNVHAGQFSWIRTHFKNPKFYPTIYNQQTSILKVEAKSGVYAEKINVTVSQDCLFIALALLKYFPDPNFLLRVVKDYASYDKAQEKYVSDSKALLRDFGKFYHPNENLLLESFENYLEAKNRNEKVKQGNGKSSQALLETPKCLGKEISLDQLL